MKVLLCWSLLLVAVSSAFAVVCPDGSTCDDGSTCCELAENRYGCCPLPEAVCCDDKEHCCPNGYTCSEGMCFTQKMGARRINSTLVCPGGQYTCSDGETCCPAGGIYTCCPLPDATCCSDGAHCCPSGTTCDLAHQTCNVPIVKIAGTAASRRPGPRVVVCPGGEYQCPDGSTCCLLASGEYGCCPLPDAVCCDDKIHCCPGGYTCNQGRCTQLTTPAPDPPMLGLLPGNRETTPTVRFVACPDGSKCPDQNTCCMLSSGKYGCCPLPQAVCCSDHLHCCPNGSHCDVAAGRCTSGDLDEKAPLVVPWVRKVPSLPRPRDDDLNEV